MLEVPSVPLAPVLTGSADIFVSAHLLPWQQVQPRVKVLQKYSADSHKVSCTYPQSPEGTSFFMPPQSFDFFETALCLVCATCHSRFW